jgi:hypothetical protein
MIFGTWWWMPRPAEAQVAYRNALQASELDPVFQKELVMALRKKSGQ